jgi:hypothetical protein
MSMSDILNMEYLLLLTVEIFLTLHAKTWWSGCW